MNPVPLLVPSRPALSDFRRSATASFALLMVARCSGNPAEADLVESTGESADDFPSRRNFV
jgi:hypothetical protein